MVRGQSAPLTRPVGHPLPACGEREKIAKGIAAGFQQPNGWSSRSYFGCTTVIVAGVDLPTPRNCGRYMSSTSDGGTV